ncbi:MAG TPA: ankyrin repeat domain-containing protein [Candidatus Omnitrophota bacterium]|nr:ankyrin repeat domain-containing protein [Candidatus Omnitrophota bacterium]HPN88241.1 ankyrin repeat domain-containing protein [Candidatus Omnitrophota bacterium]
MLKTISLLIFCFIISFSTAHADFKKGGLYSQARNGNIPAVKKLLKEKENQNQERLNKALEAAVSGRRIEMIKFLIKQGANPNMTSVGPSPLLINAIMYGYFEAAKTLILLKADVNVQGYKRNISGFQIHWHWTPLMAAAYHGQFELIKLLINKKADIHKEGWSQSSDDIETAADIAAYCGHMDILNFLLKKGATINPNTIFKVARGGHTQIMELLLKKNEDINRPGPIEEKTLLMEASWWGHKEIIELLLKNGAQINKTDTRGYTALSEAVSSTRDDFFNQREIVKLLIDNGADVNQPDFLGITPLMRANKTDIIKLLIDNGAKD